MEPIVSVIIPTYRRPEFLRRAIHSVLAQTFKDFELLVVENGENNDGKKIVEEFQRTDNRLQYFYEKQADQSLARNIGVRVAKGKHIAFLDDDDEWLPVKLEQQVEVAEQDPAIGLVTCRGWLVDEMGQVLGLRPRFDGPLSFKTLITNWCCIWSLSSVLIRRACFDRVGFFDSTYYIASDYDIYLRLARCYRLVRVEEPLFRYAIHSGQLSRNLEPTMQQTINVLRSLRATKRFGVTQGMIRERIAKCQHAVAVEARDARQYPQAAQYYLNSVWSDPLIGGKIAWSRFDNPVYRLLRPYANVVQCGWRSLGGLTR